MFGLPLLQHFVTVTASKASGLQEWWSNDLTIIVAVVVLVCLALWLLVSVLQAILPRKSRRTRDETWGQGNSVAPGVPERQAVLVDGSNVIYWQDNTPQLAPLLQVVRDLSQRGLKPGVVFDANVGYKLTGKFMGERDLSRLLSVPRDQILVVPKGTQADPFLLETARNLKARIVTNDRYRDWTDRFPEVAHPDRLIRGGMQDGKLWMTGLEAQETVNGGAL